MNEGICDNQPDHKTAGVGRMELPEALPKRTADSENPMLIDKKTQDGADLRGDEGGGKSVNFQQFHQNQHEHRVDE